MSQQKSSTKNVVKITCIQCNTEFFGSVNSKLCSPECRHQHKKDYENNARLKSSLLKFPDSADPNTYVECKLCGLRAADIGSHIRIHKISTKDYTQLYGGIKCKNFVDAMLGDKNPAYQHGGKLSPFSKKFINYKGDEYIENLKEQAVQTKEENHNNPCTVEYYIKRGMSEDEAIDALRERQTTFSLEICIEKHGTIKGREVWTERQLKWAKSYKKQNFSKISQLLFDELIKLYDFPNIHFATKDKHNEHNQEYRLKLHDGTIVFPDFICLDTKRIIEFDGDYWHSERVANPSKERDRDKRIINSGYSVLHIKECDFKKHKQRVIDECITFLKQ